MAYTPPTFNQVNFDLKPSGSAAVTPPAFNAVNFNLAVDDVAGGGTGPGDTISDNARIRNFAILLAI